MYEKKELKSWQIWLPTFIGLALGLGLFAGIALRPAEPTIVIQQNNEDGKSAVGYGRMEELIRYIDARYVEDVEDEKLVEEAIDHLLDQLDPHSSYIPSAEVEEMGERLRGDFVGIGIEYMILEDTLMVVKALEGGPSEEAGIKPLDKIIQVGDSTIAGKGMTNGEVVEYLRGKVDSKVELGVQRIGEKDLQFFTVKRDRITNSSIDVGYMLDDKTGLIKVNRFSSNTYKEFMENVERLYEKEGMKNLVIDLRQNPGGYLQEATKMLSQFFKDRGKILVYTEGTHSERHDYESTGATFFDIEKIAVLIDEGSASASEIVAGALQDWDRGVIIGRRSFGKGLVQEQYKLSDGSALHLTVSRYYTPSGRSIQRDYSDAEKYEDDFTARYESGELQDPAKFANNDTTEYYTAGGRVVYGGGGISPDLFVPLDTFLFTTYYLRMRGKVPPFMYRFFENRVEEMRQWEKEDEFLENYQISEATFEEFLAFAETDEKLAKRNEKILRKTKYALLRDLKARLGKHLFDQETFFKTQNENDEMVLEALDWFSGKKPLVELKK